MGPSLAYAESHAQSAPRLRRNSSSRCRIVCGVHADPGVRVRWHALRDVKHLGTVMMAARDLCGM
jgi:hypothetical protein